MPFLKELAVYSIEIAFDEKSIKQEKDRINEENRAKNPSLVFSEKKIISFPPELLLSLLPFSFGPVSFSGSFF